MKVFAHLFAILAFVVATTGFSHAGELTGENVALSPHAGEQISGIHADQHDEAPDSAVHCGALFVCLNAAPVIVAMAPLPVLEPLASSTRAYLLVHAEIPPPRS